MEVKEVVKKNISLQEKADIKAMDSTVEAYKEKLETLQDKLDLLEARNEVTRENKCLSEEIDLLDIAIQGRMDFAEFTNKRNLIWKDYHS